MVNDRVVILVQTLYLLLFIFADLFIWFLVQMPWVSRVYHGDIPIRIIVNTFHFFTKLNPGSIMCTTDLFWLDHQQKNWNLFFLRLVCQFGGLIFAGGENEGPWFIPDILVNVHRAGEESIGVIREALPVWWPDLVACLYIHVLLYLYEGSSSWDKIWLFFRFICLVSV